MTDMTPEERAQAVVGSLNPAEGYDRRARDWARVFQKHITASITEAVAAERAACAEITRNLGSTIHVHEACAHDIAKAIEARSTDQEGGDALYREMNICPP